MPTLPASTITVADGVRATGYAGSADTLLVAGCCSAGPYNTLQLYSRVSSLVTDYGYGPAVEAAAHVLERSGKRVLFARMPGTTVGTNSSVDAEDVAGTSVITLTGEPYDDYEGVITVVTGGTRGTTGIEFTYSLDGGRTTSATIALGTATTYAIPHSGLTLNFAAGTLVAADVATWLSTAPRWDSGDLDDLVTAMEANTTAIVGMLVTGDLAAADVDTIDTALASYATTRGRFTFAFGNVRRARPTRRALSPLSLTFAEVGGTGDTITRASGSFVTDGIAVGDAITITGAANAANNLIGAVIANLSATVITLGSDDLVAEGPVTCTVSAVEGDATWVAALRTSFDAKSSKRLSLWAGHAPTVSSVLSNTPQRPSSWAAAARYLARDLSKSLAEVNAGPLAGVSLVDEHGDTIGHDEAATPGLLDGRFGCLRTFDGRQGAYVALPMVFAPTGSDFDRVHLRAVIDLACTVAKQSLEGVLSSAVLLSTATGNTIDESEARRIEALVNRALANALTARGRVTSATYQAARDDDLTAADPVLTGTVYVRPLGYVESIDTTVQFAVSA